MFLYVERVNGDVESTTPSGTSAGNSCELLMRSESGPTILLNERRYDNGQGSALPSLDSAGSDFRARKYRFRDSTRERFHENRPRDAVLSLPQRNLDQDDNFGMPLKVL